MKYLIYKIVSVLILCLSFGIGALWYQYDVYLATTLPIKKDSMLYEIKPGDNLTRVVRNLQKLGIVKHPRYLLWYAHLTADANDIHVGEYELTAELTQRQMMDVFLSGKVKHYNFTIIEGWTFKQMINQLANQPHLTKRISSKTTDQQIMQKLGFPDQHPEGRFLPDTYRYVRGMSDIDVLQRAYNAMQDYLAKAWASRDFPVAVKSPYEALILASIVEKETGLVTERKAIAGVFSRRLYRKMRLQTDPTVIYGMGINYHGNIRRKDLTRDTPYNTYTRYGLPPTPIAMPSREAIDAALHPDDSENIYFVAKGDGSHYFSSTLQEHNAAVIKYQLKGKKRNFSSFKNK